MEIPYILIMLIVLGVIFAFVAWKRRKDLKRLSALSALAFGFIIAGIVFNDSRSTSYTLLGIGVALALAEILIKLRNKK